MQDADSGRDGCQAQAQAVASSSAAAGSTGLDQTSEIPLLRASGRCSRPDAGSVTAPAPNGLSESCQLPSQGIRSLAVTVEAGGLAIIIRVIACQCHDAADVSWRGRSVLVSARAESFPSEAVALTLQHEARH
eukprot:1677481-Rhodomonas_salina.1